MKENGLTLEKLKNRRSSARTITDAEYSDDIALLTNILALAESLLHSLERTAGDISIHINADKIEYMYFNQGGDLFTLNGGSLKLVNKFTYLGSSIPSTENGINTRLAKVWIAINRLSVI